MNSMTEFFAALRKSAPEIESAENEPLSNHTSFRIGGPAAVFAKPKTEAQLRTLLELSGKMDVEPVIIGAGTNVLAPDEGLDTLVICTRGCLGGIRRAGETGLEAGAGVTLTQLANFACEAGLAGLEFAHGIPGTVGGGAVMNAGAYGGELADVQTCTWGVRQDGRAWRCEGAEQGFGYRKSAFARGGAIVTRAEYRLTPDDPAAIRARMNELFEKRRASQPLDVPSAGSAFKRPEGAYAAALIDEAGLKGTRVGGAAVSEKHAGFLINAGGATAEDVRALIKLVQERVFEASGIRLEPEIRIL